MAFSDELWQIAHKEIILSVDHVNSPKITVVLVKPLVNINFKIHTKSIVSLELGLPVNFQGERWRQKHM